ncbi:MAG: hypothetical protein JXA67_07220 [Micromonosporaceae bacterium]|nr:hypothetical protein [Micromonosporaceae bacterium]
MTTPTPLDDLKERYHEERFYGDDRAAAQYAYAIAVRLRAEGSISEARRYARECLRIAQALPAHSPGDVTTDWLVLGGVALPERFHHRVVQAQLHDLLGEHEGCPD